MIDSSVIFTQVKDVTFKLERLGLSVEKNFPTHSKGEIAYSGEHDISIALKNIAYEDLYKKLEEKKNFNFKMLDGALIQMLYRFDKKNLVSHRLAFFPSPNLESFQNEPEIYEQDEIYADILAKNVVTFPIRFDYSPEQFKELWHPKSHLTLGQYKNCRIPVSEPLTPILFINFILRNFYHTAFHQFTNQFNTNTERFESTITDLERELLHLSIK
jgi:hypothetical protein